VISQIESISCSSVRWSRSKTAAVTARTLSFARRPSMSTGDHAGNDSFAGHFRSTHGVARAARALLVRRQQRDELRPLDVDDARDVVPSAAVVEGDLQADLGGLLRRENAVLAGHRAAPVRNVAQADGDGPGEEETVDAHADDAVAQLQRLAELRHGEGLLGLLGEPLADLLSVGTDDVGNGDGLSGHFPLQMGALLDRGALTDSAPKLNHLHRDL
jgi:hypothetical protein